MTRPLVAFEHRRDLPLLIRSDRLTKEKEIRPQQGHASAAAEASSSLGRIHYLQMPVRRDTSRRGPRRASHGYLFITHYHEIDPVRVERAASTAARSDRSASAASRIRSAFVMYVRSILDTTTLRLYANVLKGSCKVSLTARTSLIHTDALGPRTMQRFCNGIRMSLLVVGMDVNPSLLIL